MILDMLAEKGKYSTVLYLVMYEAGENDFRLFTCMREASGYLIFDKN